jgi:hypothetical protein
MQEMQESIAGRCRSASVEWLRLSAPTQMKKKLTYRITFHNHGKLYELFARDVRQSGLFGFIEIENIVFGEKSTVVVDPSEESLKTEFEGVNRIHVPMHSVVRIDEVEKIGHAKILSSDGNITPFPVYAGGKEAPRK